MSIAILPVSMDSRNFTGVTSMYTYILSKSLSDLFDTDYFENEMVSDQKLQEKPKDLSLSIHKPNPVARERMLNNNPMHDPKIVAKVSNSLKGNPAHNKIHKMFLFICQECNKQEHKRDTAHNRAPKFCSKSCAAANYNRTSRDYSVIRGPRKSNLTSSRC